MKTCPYCAEEVQDAAVKCKHCGSMLNDTIGGMATITPDGGRAPSKPGTTPGTGGGTDWGDTLDGAATYAPESLTAGHVLAGRYRLDSIIGSGGMGVVWRATDSELEQDVAVKVLPGVLSRNKASIESLKAEAKLSLKLAHPNICRLTNFHSDGNVKFLIMEYIEGQTLQSLLASRPDKKLTLDEVLPIAKHIGEALDYAHSLKPPVLHRDIKPANIMIAPDGSAKLLDFGIAREIKDTMTQVTGKVETAGTLPYMSPEQFRGSKMTTASDTYSLAAVLYECLAGKPYITPYGDPSYQILQRPYEEIENAPPEINTALKAALAKDANERKPFSLTVTPPAPSRREKRELLSPPTPAPKPTFEPSPPPITSAKPSVPWEGSRPGELPARKAGVVKWLWILAIVIAGIAIVGVILVVVFLFSRGPSDSPSSPSHAPVASVSIDDSARLKAESDARIAQAEIARFRAEAEVRRKAEALAEAKRQRDAEALRSRPPSFLPAVSDAAYASLSGLASGSKEAQAAQKAAVAKGMPLEAKLKKTGIRFRLIPAGSFTMGSPANEKYRNNNEASHRVTLTKPFYMGTYEITQGQWEKVMGTRPWSGKTYAKSNSDHAVSYVSWEDAQSFIKKLETLEGLPKGSLKLPTESQWEYACRAGTSTAYVFGDKDSALGEYAWYYKNAADVGQQYAHAVGQKKPNAFGLYDMHGNVWEWCDDWYDEDYYKKGSRNNPNNQKKSVFRVLRGGSWDYIARHFRSANRFRLTPVFRYCCGFRLSLDFTP